MPTHPLDFCVASDPDSPRNYPPQVGGTHYRGDGYDPYGYARHNNLNALEFSIVKYVTRHRRKGKRLDLLKALQTLQRLLAEEYPGEEEKPVATAIPAPAEKMVPLPDLPRLPDKPRDRGEIRVKAPAPGFADFSIPVDMLTGEQLRGLVAAYGSIDKVVASEGITLSQAATLFSYHYMSEFYRSLVGMVKEWWDKQVAPPRVTPVAASPTLQEQVDAILRRSEGPPLTQ